MMPPGCLKLAARSGSTWVISAASGILAVWLSLVYVSPILDQPPVSILRSRILTPTVAQNGYLVFLVTVSTTAKSCPGNITREFQRRSMVDGRPLWEKWREAAIAPPVADENAHEYTVAVSLLPGMPAGTWRFIGETVYDCPWWRGGISRVRTLPMEFEVTEGTTK